LIDDKPTMNPSMQSKPRASKMTIDTQRPTHFERIFSAAIQRGNPASKSARDHHAKRTASGLVGSHGQVGIRLSLF